MMNEEIPEFEDKLFYRINEVSKITGIEDYVLRYWESEFPQLCPQKNKNKIRLYKKDDIILVFKIKRLLKEHKFTINGAKDYLKKEHTMKSSAKAANTEKAAEEDPKTTVSSVRIKSVRRKLGQIKTEISDLLRGL